MSFNTYLEIAGLLERNKDEHHDYNMHRCIVARGVAKYMYILQLPENQVISGSPSVKPIIPLIHQGGPLAHKGNVAYHYLTHWDWEIRLWNHIYLVIFNSNQG